MSLGVGDRTHSRGSSCTDQHERDQSYRHESMAWSGASVLRWIAFYSRSSALLNMMRWFCADCLLDHVIG